MGSIYLHCDPTANAYLRLLMDAVFGRKAFRNEIVWCYTGPGNFKRDFPRKHDTIFRYVRGKKWTFNADAVRKPYSAETLARRGRAEGNKGIVSPSVEIDTEQRRTASQVKERFGAARCRRIGGPESRPHKPARADRLADPGSPWPCLSASSGPAATPATLPNRTPTP